MTDTTKMLQALSAYTGDADSLTTLTQVFTEELGENWPETVYDHLSGIDAATKEKLDHAFSYYAAVTAWNEIQEYLAQPALDPTEVSPRLPVLEHWLAFFGEPGHDVLNKLREKMALQGQVSSAEETVNQAAVSFDDMPEKQKDDSPVSTDSDMGKTTPAENISSSQNNFFTEEEAQPSLEDDEHLPETPENENPFRPSNMPENSENWLVEKTIREIIFVRQVQSWINARCIELGNIEKYAYKHYGFLIDLVRCTLKDIQSVLSNNALYPLVENKRKDGILFLQNTQLYLEQEIASAEENCESDITPLIADSIGREDLKKALGVIDTTQTKEYLGPAPDGFEEVADPYETARQDRQLQQEYSTLEKQPSFDQYALEEEIPEKTKSQPLVKNTSQTGENSVKKKMSFSFVHAPTSASSEE